MPIICRKIHFEALPNRELLAGQSAVAVFVEALESLFEFRGRARAILHAFDVFFEGQNSILVRVHSIERFG